MQKRTIIKKIKAIINKWGGFSIGEVQADCSPCVNSMGELTTLAERFEYENITVNVYNKNGDEEDSYTMRWDELSKDVLEEIFELAEQYDAEQFKTKKRCNN